MSAEAFIESSNTEVATVDRSGLVTAVRRGETTIMVRYEGSYAAASLIVMGDRSGFAWKGAPENNYIDALVYQKLKQVKVQPSDLCSDSDFIRRLTIDLTGLPPTPQEIDAFLADKSKDAFAKVVDRLLASPQYGETWGRHWLDLMRYAETRGHEYDYAVPNAHQYRNYVIRAFNADVPYSQLVLEHVAGDLLPEPRLNPAAPFNEMRWVATSATCASVSRRFGM